jgi:hypothetical protein
MWLFYIDESGNTGTRLDDPDQPIHYLIALGVHESKVNALETEFRHVVETLFGEDIWRNSFEIKGQALRKGSAGYLKSITIDQRVELVRNLLALVGLFDGKIFYTGIEKTKYKDGRHPHREAFLHTVFQLDEWLEKQIPAQLGLLVADEQHELEQRLIDDIIAGKRHPRPEERKKPMVTSILDGVHLVRSSNSVLIQLADLVAFTINRGLKNLDLNQSAQKADGELYQLIASSIESGYIYPKTKQ